MTNLVKEKEYGVNIDRDSYIRGIASLISAVEEDTAEGIIFYIEKTYQNRKFTELSNDELMNIHTFSNKIFLSEVDTGRAIIGTQDSEHSNKVSLYLKYIYS